MVVDFHLSLISDMISGIYYDNNWENSKNIFKISPWLFSTEPSVINYFVGITKLPYSVF